MRTIYPERAACYQSNKRIGYCPCAECAERDEARPHRVSSYWEPTVDVVFAGARRNEPSACLRFF